MRRNYIIKFPDQLVVGDIVLDPKTRSFVLVSFVDNCNGAGHIEFGEYVVITGYSKESAHTPADFWSFRDEPLIVLA